MTSIRRRRRTSGIGIWRGPDGATPPRRSPLGGGQRMAAIELEPAAVSRLPARETSRQNRKEARQDGPSEALFPFRLRRSPPRGIRLRSPPPTARSVGPHQASG